MLILEKRQGAATKETGRKQRLSGTAQWEPTGMQTLHMQNSVSIKGTGP